MSSCGKGLLVALVVTLMAPFMVQSMPLPSASSPTAMSTPTGTSDNSKAAKAACASLPAFTFGKLVERVEPGAPDGKARLHVVLNIKSTYTGKIQVALWRGFAAVPSPAQCGDKDLLTATSCNGAVRMTAATEEFESSSDGKDNQVIFRREIALKDIFNQTKVLVYYKTETDSNATGCSNVTGSALASVADLHTFEIDAGALWVVQKAAATTSDPNPGINFKSQFEAAYTESDIWGRDIKSYTDVRYSYIGAVSGSGGGGNNPQSAPAKVGNDSTSTTPNPFQSGGGILRANLYFSLWAPQFKERSATISPIIGAGFTTVPDDSNVRAPLRGFVGLRFDIPDLNTSKDAAHFGGSSGYLQVGYAYDNFWAYDKTPSIVAGMPGAPGQRNRIFIEGQIKLPNAAISAAPRIFVDLPASTAGHTDLRISALAAIDATQLGSWFGLKSGS